jgi:nucleotide-binding universal stress UspA family protein
VLFQGREMFKKIAVPLDGSKLAALIPGSQVQLISVTERVVGFRAMEDPSSPTGQRLSPEAVGKMERQANRYLDRIARGMKSKGIDVQTAVLYGKPADEIVFYVETEKPELLITGPSRWAFGSVADRVSRSVNIPVMVIRAPGCQLSPATARGK